MQSKNARKWLEKQYEQDLKRYEELFGKKPYWETIEARINDVYHFYLMRAVNESATLSGDQQAVVEKLTSEIFMSEDDDFDYHQVLNLATYINSCHE